MAMLDLRQSASPSPVVLSMNRRSTLHSLDQPVLSQIILRSHAAILADCATAAELPAAYLAAMRQLVKRIAQLRSSDAFAEDAFAETEGPEPNQALLTAVTPEAQAVLDQSSAVLVQSLVALATLGQSEATAQSGQQLIPVLLWGVAQSNHEVMQLLEGMPAQMQQAGRWQTGILRLLVILRLSSASQTHCFDLVTQQPPVLLSPDHQLYIPHSLLGQPSISGTTLLQRLTIQIDHNQSILHPFLAGFAAHWLIPGQSWQTGEVNLSLGLAFTPATAPSAEPDSGAMPLPTIKFEQATWLEQHITAAVEHQLTQILHQQMPSRSDATGSLLESHATLTAQQAGQLAVVTRGCHAIDELQRSVTLASRTFAQQSLTLDDLALRLLWNINRTAYEVMQWLSGVAVRLLQPEGRWSSGRLRFAVRLQVQTPAQQWQFDLAARTSGLAAAAPLDPETIVQSDHCVWCSQPVLLSLLTARIWQAIEQHAPEVALLQTATEATISTETALGELGAVQLIGAFEYCEA